MKLTNKSLYTRCRPKAPVALFLSLAWIATACSSEGTSSTDEALALSGNTELGAATPFVVGQTQPLTTVTTDSNNDALLPVSALSFIGDNEADTANSATTEPVVTDAPTASSPFEVTSTAAQTDTDTQDPGANVQTARLPEVAEADKAEPVTVLIPEEVVVVDATDLGGVGEQAQMPSVSDEDAKVVTMSWNAATADDLGYYIYYKADDNDYRFATQVNVVDLVGGNRQIQFDLPESAARTNGVACFKLSAWSSNGETGLSDFACANV